MPWYLIFQEQNNISNKSQELQQLFISYILKTIFKYQMSNRRTSGKSPKKQIEKKQEIPPALKVFSKTRDIEASNPYHLDGDMQMYSQQKLKQRQQLSKDPDIRRQIEQIVKMFELEDGKIKQKEYKRMQRKMAIALRPDIDEEQLQFVVDEDWKLDSKNGEIDPVQMGDKIFELIDVWTLGTERTEYITFTKLLGKKIQPRK